MAKQLSRRTISRDGVKDRRARDALRLSEENFVQLFGEVKRTRFWSVAPGNLESSFATNGFVNNVPLVGFKLTASPALRKAVVIGVAPSTVLIDVGVTGVPPLPQQASLTLKTTNCRAGFNLALFRDGFPIAAIELGAVGVSGTSVTGTYFNPIPPGVAYFVDNNPGGVPHNYDLRWSAIGVPFIAPPSVFETSLSLIGCMMFAQEIF